MALVRSDNDVFSFISALVVEKSTLLYGKFLVGQNLRVSIHTPRDSPGNRILCTACGHKVNGGRITCGRCRRISCNE